MTTNLNDLIYLRHEEVDGQRDWWWIKGDTNAWEGPTENWVSDHKYKYFKYLRGLDTVITAGANHGLHVRFYAQRFRRVIALEPNPLAFHCLCLNAPFDNVIKLQAALSDQCGRINIAGNPAVSGMWRVVSSGGLEVPAIKIDSLDLDKCDFIQLDVEGYEGTVLKGASKTLWTYRPVVALENGHTSEIEGIMRELNYECKEQSVADAIWVPKSV